MQDSISHPAIPATTPNSHYDPLLHPGLCRRSASLLITIMTVVQTSSTHIHYSPPLSLFFPLQDTCSLAFFFLSVSSVVLPARGSTRISGVTPLKFSPRKQLFPY